MDDSRPPRPKRRWYQFRLRTLLLLVVLVSVGMSWFTVKLHRARRQRAAVQGILGSGGSVLYDYDYVDDGRVTLGGQPPGPAWLRETLGVDFFCDVKTVLLLSDAGAEHLEGLTSVEWVVLDGPGVTDAVLDRLKGASRLRHLILVDTSVTDEGVKELREALPDCKIHE